MGHKIFAWQELLYTVCRHVRIENVPHSHRVSSSFRIQKLICKLRLRLLMILVPASDCLQHKFGANDLNGRNLNVRAVEVQLDSVAGTKLLGLLKRTDRFL